MNEELGPSGSGDSSLLAKVITHKCRVSTTTLTPAAQDGGQRDRAHKTNNSAGISGKVHTEESFDPAPQKPEWDACLFSKRYGELSSFLQNIQGGGIKYCLNV